MQLFYTEPSGSIEIGNDTNPLDVTGITGHVFEKDTAEIFFKTPKGTLCLELNQSETQKLFSEVNRMTGLFPD